MGSCYLVGLRCTLAEHKPLFPEIEQELFLVLLEEVDAKDGRGFVVTMDQENTGFFNNIFPKSDNRPSFLCLYLTSVSNFHPPLLWKHLQVSHFE